MNPQETAFFGSREQVIPEEAFLALVKEAASGLLALREEVRAGKGREWTRRFISRLLREVHTLRSLLYDHAATENRTYSYLAEVVAGIRGFATVIYVLKHLRERYLRSPLPETFAREEEFLEETTRTVSWCAETLRRLFVELLLECDDLAIELPAVEATEQVNGASPPTIRKRLPRNFDEEEILGDGELGEGEKVAQVAAGFLRVIEEYEAVVPPRLETFPELRDFVRGKLGEEQARTFESKVHAIQSKYDTYIQHTSSEAREPDLRCLRCSISLLLHLFEVTTHLVHFYERHENDIRSAAAKERIARIVDKKMLLDRAVNYAFRGAGWFTGECQEIAERLIPAFTSIREVRFTIPEDVRLHIRPAALIAGVVNHHGTPVRMDMDGEGCDAGSVTEVIFLAGSHLNAKEVAFRGDEHPLADLRSLFEVGLRDDGHEAILDALPYLRSG